MQDGLGDSQAVSGGAARPTDDPTPLDTPMALGDCIAELAESLGIEVTR